MLSHQQNQQGRAVHKSGADHIWRAKILILHADDFSDMVSGFVAENHRADEPAANNELKIRPVRSGCQARAVDFKNIDQRFDSSGKRNMQILKKMIKTPLHISGYEINKRIVYDENMIEFLHIPKCAGSQITHVINQINVIAPRVVLRKHLHRVHLSDLPRQSRYFFSIREPISRFYSGFYSAKRKGFPRTVKSWSASERLAFDRFPEANDLAESLFSSDVSLACDAFCAMKSIGHLVRKQMDWISFCGFFHNVRPPVFIIRQSEFEQDLKSFLKLAGLSEYESQIELAPPGSPERNSLANSLSTPLSAKAIENLKVWYADEIAFYSHCERWIIEHDAK